MKHYIELAKQYFEYMEGLQHYPPIWSYQVLLWLVTVATWLGSMAWFFVERNHLPWPPMIGAIAITEIAWLAVAAWISNWKDKQVLAATNQRLGTSFADVSSCRQRVLQDLVSQAPSEYLSLAKEIRDLVELRSKFRKRSDLDFSEIGRSIYDRDSKARLLTLLIALCSMLVALSVRSEATLEAVFDVYANPGGQKFIVFVAFMTLALFMMVFGLRVLMRSVLDGLTLWAAKVKFLRHAFFADWVVGYLVRDLVVYHDPTKQASPQAIPVKPPALVAQGAEEGKTQAIAEPQVRGDGDVSDTHGESSVYVPPAPTKARDLV